MTGWLIKSKHNACCAALNGTGIAKIESIATIACRDWSGESSD